MHRGEGGRRRQRKVGIFRRGGGGGARRIDTQPVLHDNELTFLISNRGGFASDVMLTSLADRDESVPQASMYKTYDSNRGEVGNKQTNEKMWLLAWRGYHSAQMHIILHDILNGRSFSIESPSENPPYSGRHGKVQSPTVPGSKRSTKNAPNEKKENPIFVLVILITYS